MGPDFPLQRIRVLQTGYEVYPLTSEGGDCVTRHFKDPNYVAPTRKPIPLVSETYSEPGECRDSED